MIKLIITADDFGSRKLYNRMILELIRENSLTSVSVLAEQITSEQEGQIKSLQQMAKTKKISIGLHIYFKSLNFTKEIERQYKTFLKIFKFEPSHLDIHKMHFLKDGYPIIQKFCKQKKIPCKNMNLFHPRIMSIKGVITTKNPSFDGTDKSMPEILNWLKNLKAGIHCITFHPGYYDPVSIDPLNQDRATDADKIRHIIPYLKEYKIDLANFHDLAQEVQK